MKTSEHNKLKGPLTQYGQYKELFHKAAQITYKLNNLSPDKTSEKKELFKQLLGSIGEDTEILTPFYCNIGSNIHLGRGCFININCNFLDTDTVEIGDYTLLAPGVNVICADHPTKTTERIVPKDDNYDNNYIKADGTYDETIAYTFTNTKQEVKIGKRCWIGTNAIILPGVTIGDNVIVAAGSVVTKDIPDNMIVGGVPAHIIRENK
ncbi:sugar O-acetyltransferase [Methanosphaera cuniculi]|uniref:sugar O-acetyltransferase n=1 Tax=Methanosphaera cuniculi TaxID=1077256 RepID=UPI0034E981FA